MEQQQDMKPAISKTKHRTRLALRVALRAVITYVTSSYPDPEDA